MNWQSHIRRLRDSGMTLSAIATATGSSVSTINEIARGATKEPRGQLAINLYELRPDIWGDEPEAPSGQGVKDAA